MYVPTVTTYISEEARAEELTISELIQQYSKQYKVDEALALNVACAESCTRNSEGNVIFDKFAKNSKSTASGVYQFIDSTWKYFCKGNVFDPEANVKCGVKVLAMKNGIRHWEASKRSGFGRGWENQPYFKYHVTN